MSIQTSKKSMRAQIAQEKIDEHANCAKYVKPTYTPIRRKRWEKIQHGYQERTQMDPKDGYEAEVNSEKEKNKGENSPWLSERTQINSKGGYEAEINF